MKTKTNRLFALASPVLLALVVAVSPPITKDYVTRDQAALTSRTYGIVSLRSDGGESRRSNVELADAHADLCKDNYDQCMKGCGGATSCSNECQTNYDNCMKQNQ